MRHCLWKGVEVPAQKEETPKVAPKGGGYVYGDESVEEGILYDAPVLLE